MPNNHLSLSHNTAAMTHNHRIVHPDHQAKNLVTTSGAPIVPPDNWNFLPAGDAAITRKVKAQGDTWVVQVKQGRRLISKGIWAPKANILAARQEIKAKRTTLSYKKQRLQTLKRREEKQNKYVKNFYQAVLQFLDFHPDYSQEATALARQVTRHATPVGSGTVARTERIPVDQRAESAVIAWMRHKITAYDTMTIARIKGHRRTIRRQLAQQSIALLQPYRHGVLRLPTQCPLQAHLVSTEKENKIQAPSLNNEMS